MANQLIYNNKIKKIKKKKKKDTLILVYWVSKRLTDYVFLFISYTFQIVD